MPSIALTASVAANARSANLLAGQSFEFLPRPAKVDFYATGSAVGLQTDILIGGRSVVNAATVPGTARSPLRLEDGIVSAGGAGGDRLFLTVFNTTGAAIVVQVIVDITFVA